MKATLALALVLTLVAGSNAQAQDADTVSARATAHRIAAREIAGIDFDGVLAMICLPSPRPGGGGPRTVPDRSTWYARPQKVFDNLYWVGTKVHSSWALKTSAGIILIDTLFNYAVEPEIIDGLTALGLDPADIKYVIISHAHGDHDEGAALLQSRYGSHVVLGAADWDLIEKSPDIRGGPPHRDVVAADGDRITLGDTAVTLVATPGHTLGTLSAIFQVRDHGRPLTVAYSGGTSLNFGPDAARDALYIASQRKMEQAARAAGATVLLSNHSQNDHAYERARLAQATREPGETHPLEIGAEAVARYFQVTAECAQAARLEAGGE